MGVIDRCASCYNVLVRHQAGRGTGFPKDRQPRLFEVFFRAQNRGTVAGTTLGLIMARQAAERPSGTLFFESYEAKGATFTVVLPGVRIEIS